MSVEHTNSVISIDTKALSSGSSHVPVMQNVRAQVASDEDELDDSELDDEDELKLLSEELDDELKLLDEELKSLSELELDELSLDELSELELLELKLLDGL